MHKLLDQKRSSARACPWQRTREPVARMLEDAGAGSMDRFVLRFFSGQRPQRERSGRLRMGELQAGGRAARPGAERGSRADGGGASPLSGPEGALASPLLGGAGPGAGRPDGVRRLSIPRGRGSFPFNPSLSSFFQPSPPIFRRIGLRVDSTKF
uniref:Uncharacterized protein n=1 Tax=Setaria viridis TaxID=4556 RepID=A0A4U6UL81_SETVI|nr:hypothetical protein SEVIR_5G287950v2 [Setaria viridis]